MQKPDWGLKFTCSAGSLTGPNSVSSSQLSEAKMSQKSSLPVVEDLSVIGAGLRSLGIPKTACCGTKRR